jgi:hypothetical protein
MSPTTRVELSGVVNCVGKASITDLCLACCSDEGVTIVVDCQKIDGENSK